MKKALNLYKSGRFDEAARHFEAILRDDPCRHEASFTLGVIHFRNGRNPEAIDLIRRAIELQPDAHHYHMTLGILFDGIEDFKSAETCFRRALALKPDDPVSWGALGDTYRKVGRLAAALNCVEKALESAPDSAEIHRQKGVILYETNQIEAARRSLETARGLDPESVEILISLGVMLRSIGDIDRARDILGEAIERDPENASAQNHLAQLKPATAGDPRIPRLEKAVRIGHKTSNEMLLLHHTLGQMYADIGQYDEAFRSFTESNRIRSTIKGGEFSIEAFTAQVDACLRGFDAAFFRDRRDYGSPDDLPVLVMGMPRSGTTLLERIIASHPAGFGAGELTALSRLRRQFTSDCQGEAIPTVAAARDDALVKKVAAAYLQHLREFSSDALRIVDKMPGNFMELWLPALALPRARIVHARRNALDTCLSCFLTEFTSAHGYRNDLRTLGLYYRQYRRLTDHWQAVLPSPMLNVQYEDVVTDQEAQSRRILDFCGLDWDPACLEFHRSHYAVRTASTVQVRRRVYTSSVGRWRLYQDHLDPLFEALGPELVAEAEMLEKKAL